VPPRSVPDQPMDVLEADLPYTGPNGVAGSIRTTWQAVHWGPAGKAGSEPAMRLQLVSASPRTA
jgi:hypothetical protein